ncbi:MAG: tetratricopeptide repeat protein [Candidatus Omnitrophica bacterium]|nr:tetratricopeptide repeat protein [Candidatus Omnitrophota bacterium]
MKKISKIRFNISNLPLALTVFAALLSVSHLTAGQNALASEMTPYERIMQDLEETHQLFNVGRYEEAVLGYTDVIQRGLKGPSIYFGLAQSYRMLKLYQNAIKYFDMAIELSPSFSDAYLELARTYEALGYPEETEKNYINALEKGTPSDLTFANFGFFKLNAQPPQIANAQRLVDAGLEMYPDNPHILYLKANILLKTGKYEECWAVVEGLRFRNYDGLENSLIEELTGYMDDPYHQVSVKRRIQRLEERQNLYLMTQSINAAAKTYANNTAEQNQ